MLTFELNYRYLQHCDGGCDKSDRLASHWQLCPAHHSRQLLRWCAWLLGPQLTTRVHDGVFHWMHEKHCFELDAAGADYCQCHIMAKRAIWILWQCRQLCVKSLSKWGNLRGYILVTQLHLLRDQHRAKLRAKFVIALDLSHVLTHRLPLQSVPSRISADPADSHSLYL